MKKAKPYFEQRRERRSFLRAGVAVAATGTLAGCDSLSHNETAVNVLRSAEALTESVHRVLGRRAMAQEFSPSQIAPVFRANGTTSPIGQSYAAMVADGFKDWTLTVDGLVDKPLELTMAELQAMPTRTQITRHDCVEGWSCIGQWKGVRLSHLLNMATLKPEAKFVVFRCLDQMDEKNEDTMYYESVDLDDAFHEQTILAWELNGKPLPVANGAPLRARIERQLGYKQPKYLHHIEVVSDFSDIAGGKGGFWEDHGYNWYGGI
ncbi:molybdopterin-dependent oxidoreductase [Caenimonas koreensis DSM 17982]|uniref:Molybdopterin-dependent oxidoreductase n=1 Tax=Caenimonas koreensis DSM 17982 TaxID=1121255 RepID=A0A844B543_9BURK|nr:molybdopterin-dependent oxidoreductase [Caenimonas koreensis]MRD46789.1 molybdopterin-dependent oxidoreductase [Caenimonas koreensis DSM 17982]